MNNWIKTAAIMAAFLFVLTTIPTFPNYSNAQSYCSAGPSFSVLGTSWGVGGSPFEAGAGSQSAPLDVRVEYFSGGCAVTNLQSSLGTLPSAFASLDGTRTANAYATSVPANTIFDLVFYLNISPYAQNGNYTVQLAFLWNNTSYSNISQNTTIQLNLKGTTDLLFLSSESSLAAGQTNNIVVTVQNQGTGSASNLEINPTLTSSLGSILNQINTAGFLPGGSSQTFILSIFVSANAAGSPLVVSLSANYYDAYSITKTYTQNLGFAVQAASQPSISISSSNGYLNVGAQNNVTFSVANTGSVSIRNVSLTISPSYPLTLVGSDGYYSLGTLNPSQILRVQSDLYLGQTSGNPPSVSLTLGYTDSSGVAHVLTRSFSFFVQNANQVPIVVSVAGGQNEITAGQTSNLSLILLNNGSSVLSSITTSMSFVTSGVSWMSPSPVLVSQISPGKSLEVSGEVFASPSSPSSVSLQATISYYDSLGNLHQQTSTLGLLVKGLEQMNITDVAITPSLISPGQVFSVTLTVTNLGTIAASNLVAGVKVPAGFESFGSSSVYVGTLQPSTPTPITITLLVKNSTIPGQYSVPVSFSFLDNLRNNDTQYGSVSVTVLSAGAAGQTTGSASQNGISRPGLLTFSLVLLVVVALAMLGIGYWIGRRRRKSEE